MDQQMHARDVGQKYFKIGGQEWQCHEGPIGDKKNHRLSKEVVE